MPKYLLPAHVCHWCGTWKGDKICSSCKKARYCSEKHQALHWRTGHKNDCLQIISSSAASNSVLPTIGKVPANTSWPEFEIKIDYEGIFDSNSGDENNSKLLVMQRHGKPDAMMQSWMDQFEVLGPFSFRITSVGLLLMHQSLYLFNAVWVGRF
ncbi:programmed cell death protein 2 [Zea mays]|uniref:programmed cell death protein 2 n=1 Tax=Zea mays TaxID=4577 RepID=UPI0009A9E14D|nr:programmed cell death protein 2 [Zea mays]|eukprot:XP_020406283.1 programmed cell death protein 2 [Zea mays]